MQNVVPVKKISFLSLLQIVFFVVLALFFGKTLFIPLSYSLFIAVVLYPVCKSLEKRKISKPVAIFICLLIIALLITALLLLLTYEIKAFAKDLPLLKNQMPASIAQLQQWLLQNFNISIAQQAIWIKNLGDSILNNTATFLQLTLAATFNTIFIACIVPVFTALFLYNRITFIQFVQLLVNDQFKPQLTRILKLSVQTFHRYIRGMILVYLAVGTLNTIGLLLLGIKHALLFGMLTAIMTIIPYLGIIISALLPISVAWITTGNIWVPLGVIAVFTIVQYLEANVIFPLIVGIQLNVNTWATLVAIIAGGIIWGVSGMILFIPFVALLKIASDYIKEWKPLNVLLSRTDYVNENNSDLQEPKASKF